ncbi:hypothetical protein ccbrp13_63030 [Ktedonobacteria bacterium brp13]|nr:hypothetical protein ccbrp13_63030 [Ktedonobacteria bacterium brp13]
MLARMPEPIRHPTHLSAPIQPPRQYKRLPEQRNMPRLTSSVRRSLIALHIYLIMLAVLLLSSVLLQSGAFGR